MITKIIENLKNNFSGVEYIYQYLNKTDTHAIQILSQDLFDDDDFIDFQLDAYDFVEENNEILVFVGPDSPLFPTLEVQENYYTWDNIINLFPEEISLVPELHENHHPGVEIIETNYRMYESTSLTPNENILNDLIEYEGNIGDNEDADVNINLELAA